MFIKSRTPGFGFGDRWRQLSKLARLALITTALFFLLAVIWGTGTVDVDYMRDRIKSISSTSDEPIPEQKSETPIIDGVPNDLNDRPIPDGVIEEPNKDDGKSKHVENKPPAEPVDHKPVDEPVKKPQPEKTQTQTGGKEDAAPVESEPKPIHTEPAKPASKALGGGVPIRVMFIGASMTLGTPPQAAYRKQLREWMVSLGNKVNCVGDNTFGHFKDNDVQAYPATPIPVLHEKSLLAVPTTQPNLIIVNAGSSDCFQEKAFGSAHGYDHTRALVDFLFASSPNTTVILSTLIPSPNARYERCIKSINAQIRQVALDVAREGINKIALSEQHYDQGLPGRVTEKFISKDDMHPTFEGWEMMGEVYKQDILDVDAKGWIVAPVDNGIMYDGDAEKDLEEAKNGGAKTETETKAKGKDGGKVRPRLTDN
ncbi:hypothetical protein F5Y17DRAFT_475843 [Xylariaceae sp. FL0594]|nr:hypothetical protein F5Y17DRAFT_475843 [Xylariaceae sp. FL0594]